MPNELPKPLTRTGSIAKRLRARRSWRSTSGGFLAGVWNAMQTPAAVWGGGIAVVFAVFSGMLAIWAREQPLVSIGRVMDETRTVRLGFTMRNIEAEKQAKETARSKSPRVLVADATVFSELDSSLRSLPVAVAGASTVEQVDEGLRGKFGLTPEVLAALKAQVAEGKASASWSQSVGVIGKKLKEHPMLDDPKFQKFSSEGLYEQVELVLSKDQPKDESTTVRRQDVISVKAANRAELMATIVKDSGLVPPLSDMVIRRLMELKPTFQEDEAASAKRQNEAAAKIGVLNEVIPKGQVIFARGEVLTQQQLELFRRELDAYRQNGELMNVTMRWLGVGAAAVAVTLALAAYTGKFASRIRGNPGRLASAAGVLLAAMAAATVATVLSPGLAAITITAPIVLVTMILTIAYDQRLALAYGALLAMLCCIALDRSIGFFTVIVVGMATAVWQLREVRERGAIARASIVTGLALAAFTVLIGLIERPLSTVTVWEIMSDAGLAAIGALICGGVTLFILPTIERLFDVATGLTLIELRDPKQPLLRELQQRAPGTYNHSLNVAAIAESAADAISANSLLTYVGALYHDIGKMNKPEYFVENRLGGPSKHDKLSPALSLLIIIGHVKDGTELAHEFGLPKALIHFIEAHHGTTLVEFFYHRAKQKAISDSSDFVNDDATSVDELAEYNAEEPQLPDEFEYRYPGPRPRTKEVAIVMLADAIESATRTLPEPTPARIDQLVRTIANKRLMDGQFDDCELTLRDLNAICDSVSRSVSAIYHGRIVYPTDTPAAVRAS